MSPFALSTSAIALVTFLTGSLAHAQTVRGPVEAGSAEADDEAGDQSGGTEIVVTANKRSESINRVPLSIQAFSGDALREAGVTDASQLTVVTPGLNFARSGGNTPIFTLRGVGFNTPNLSSTSPVGIYADEVAYAYPYMASGPLFDLQRVEVLKGPQGTLYGRNTTGGLVNFIAARPTPTLQGRVAAEFGNYETHNLEGFISGPIGSTAGFRLSGRWEASDKGWQRSITRNERLGKKDKLGFRLVLDWEPSDRLSFEVIGNYWRDRSDTVAGQAVAFIPNIPGFQDPRTVPSIRTDWRNDEADWNPTGPDQEPFETDSEFYSISGRVNYKMNDNLTIVSLTAYNDIRRHDVNDVDGTAIEVFGYTGDGRIRSFSQELRLAGEYDRFNFIIGGYYSRDKIRDNQFGQYGDSSPNNFLSFVAQNLVDPTNQLFTPEQYANGFRFFTLNLDQTSKTASFFANATYEITDKFSFTGGARYTDDRLSAFGCSRDVNGEAVPIWNTAVPAAVFLATGVFPPNQVVPNGCVGYNANYTGPLDPNLPPLNEDNLALKGSLQYTADNNNLYYVSVSRGFKSGAFPLVPTNNQTQLEPARQEEVIAYEIGAKTNFFDRRLQLNVAGFYYDYKDKQLFSEVPDIVFTTLTRIVNVPRSEAYGAELEAIWQDRSGFNARLGVAYTKTQILEYNGFDRAGQPLSFRGFAFANSPEWQINGAIGYEGDLNDSIGVRANLNANYQSSTSSDLRGENGYQIDGYATVNATVGLFSDDTGWEVGLYARNLTNTYYWTSANYYADIVYRVPGMPRTFGVQFGWNFR